MARKLRIFAKNPQDVDFFPTPEKEIYILLNNVRSMHNTGAVFRSADAFGVKKIFLGGITGCPPHREIHKTALGAEESVSWEHHPDATSLVLELKRQNFCVVAIEQSERSVELQQWSAPEGKILLVMGNEITGVEEGLLTLADEIVEIPQFGVKKSLNVSVTTAILLWEITRQWS